MAKAWHTGNSKHMSVETTAQLTLCDSSSYWPASRSALFNSCTLSGFTHFPVLPPTGRHCISKAFQKELLGSLTRHKQSHSSCGWLLITDYSSMPSKCS